MNFIHKLSINKLLGVSYDTELQAEPESCPNPENNCEPTLVLLPIFTVEDAPPEKLLDRAEDIREPLSGYIADRYIFDRF